MPKVHKTLLLPYTAEQMYDLVDAVENYPQFLSWCANVTVYERTPTALEASMNIAFKGLKQQIKTSNTNVRPSSMLMAFKDGPFRYFNGSWLFEPLGDVGVKVTFDLDYEISNALFALAAGPVINVFAQTFVDGFVRRAQVLYAK